MPPSVDTASERSEDALAFYLKETRRYPLLNARQESAAAKAMRTRRRALRFGSREDMLEAARELDLNRRTLIEANLRLVVFVARRYRNMGMELCDLVQEGNLGLMEAVERFDPRRNLRFSTYATWWIRQAITRALSQKSRPVKVPLEKLTLARLAINARPRLEMRLGRKPLVDEIAREVGSPVGKVQAALGFMPRMESLDARIGEDGSARWELQSDPASPSPWDSALDRDRRDKIRSILEVLPQRQQLILQMRFGIGLDSEHSLAEIGKILCLSRERVRQLQQDALRRLREAGDRRKLSALVEG